MTKSLSLIEDLFNRELMLNFKFKEKHIFSKYIVDKLNLETELKGHEGCVNCLEWNNTGTILASGSDDLKVIIWDPFQKKNLNVIETNHRGNIFSVKFMPFNDTLISTCAADCDIYVYDINKNSKINEIHSHRGRVKSLETSKEYPFLLWSCGEDGLVLQHDIRCSSNKTSSALINYSMCSDTKISNLEVKSISINPIRSEFIAVGTNDPFARIYDRRMISLTSIESRNNQNNINRTTKENIRYACFILKHNFEINYPLKMVDEMASSLLEFNLNDLSEDLPVTYYVPGHLPNRIDEYRKRMKNLSITFLAFSPNGKELLVNLGGEQLYLFDSVLSAENITKNNKFKHDSFKTILNEDNIYTEKEIQTKKKHKLPYKAEILKQKANSSFEEQNYLEAIEYYNQGILVVDDSPILYGNRAAALMKRNWDGDIYMAMLDCYRALSLDKMHLKSHFRLAKCLNDLKYHNEANECLKVFCKRFHEYAKTSACENLIKEVENCLNNSKKNEEKAKYIKKNKKLKTKLKDFTTYMTRSSETNNSFEEDLDDSNDEDDNNKASNNNQRSKTLKKNIDSFFKKGEKSDSDSDSSSSSKLKTKDNNEIKKDPNEILIDSKAILKKIKKLKIEANDFKSRYCGHCNVATDIKEANFLGENYICAGSDDGSFFIWDKTSTNVTRVLKGDESIVNCIQPNPFSSLLATSGIDPHVRIWCPKFYDVEDLNVYNKEVNDEHVVSDVRSAVINNQNQMNSHPFEFLFLNLNQNRQNWNGDEDTYGGQQSIACRPS